MVESVLQADCLFIRIGIIDLQSRELSVVEFRLPADRLFILIVFVAIVPTK